jgi:hypothetical protein
MEFKQSDLPYNHLVWLYDLNLLTKEALGEKIRELDKMQKKR